MENLRFWLKTKDGATVARFLNECDRDYSFDALNEAFDMEPDADYFEKGVDDE